MDIFQAIFIAIIEGLTEFLPVSSTGHMIISQKLLGVESTEFVKAFTIIIQFGAILSVIVLYRKRFFRLNNAIPAQLFVPQDEISSKARFVLLVRRMLFRYNFYVKLLVAFLPAAILGYLFSNKIDDLLESVKVVALMLVLGGIVMLFVDSWFNKPQQEQDVTCKKSFLIGCFQCIAMIPGVSRSMATIVGGMSQGLTRKHAAEFSFFLAVPTMAAATGYKVYKLFASPKGLESLKDNIDLLIVGNVVAFLVALLAIRFFIGFVTKYGFKFFGWYRIIVGGIILILLWTGHDLAVMK